MNSGPPESPGAVFAKDPHNPVPGFGGSTATRSKSDIKSELGPAFAVFQGSIAPYPIRLTPVDSGRNPRSPVPELP
jgi:hypothetical protein